MLAACLLLCSGCAGPLSRFTVFSAPRTTPVPAQPEAWVPQPPAAAPSDADAQAAARSRTESSDPPPQPSDLWTRLRDGLQLAGHGHARVDREVRWFANYPRHIYRVFEQSKPYLHYILEQVEARSMPTDLALIPFIESAYRPEATSPQGAAGLWQFTVRTGRQYGLSQDGWYEGRRDVETSTAAALDHLSRLYRRFDGNWLYALAAYNCGSRNVRQAIKRNRDRGMATDFWSLSLPRETRRYVPRVLALGQIVSDPERANVRLPPLDNRPYFVPIQVERQIALERAAESAGLDVQELRAINPALKRWATPPKGPHRLLIPANREDAFRNGLRRLSPETWMTLNAHTVREGESLWIIARRYQISVAELKSANALTNQHLHPGQELRIPSGAVFEAADPGDLDAHASADHTVMLNYAVKRGDTLWDIAQRYQVQVASIVELNRLAPGAVLQPGDQLKVGYRAEPRPPSAAAPTLRLTDNGQMHRHRVEKGDSLWLIARRYGVSIGELLQWNRLTSKALLRPGQVLTVRGEGS